MNPDNPSFRTPEESRRSEEYIEIKKQLTTATELIGRLESVTGNASQYLEMHYGHLNKESQYEPEIDMLQSFKQALEEIAKWRGGNE